MTTKTEILELTKNVLVQKKEKFHPVFFKMHEYTNHCIVNNLKKLLEDKTLKDELTNSIKSASDEIKKKKPILPTYIHKVPETLEGEGEYYDYVDNMVKWTPQINPDDPNKREPYIQLCLFYFLVSKSKKLKENKKFNSWLVDFANDWGNYLNTPLSINDDIIENFKKAPNYNVDDYFPGPSGWMSFNQFFAREIRSGRRPIDSPSDDSIIVSPADSVCQGQWKIDNDLNIFVEEKPVDSSGNGKSDFYRGTFKDAGNGHLPANIFKLKNNGSKNPEYRINAKGIKYSIRELLEGSPYCDKFQNGTFIHSFLNTYDYHRFHTPVAGYVREARPMVSGEVVLDVIIGDNNEFKAEDPTGYQFRQARGILIMESPLVGFVAVVPIGMAQVSSVEIFAEKGMKLAKGDEFGYFTFGGSDMVILFEEGVNVNAVFDSKYLVGKQIAESNKVFELSSNKMMKK